MVPVDEVGVPLMSVQAERRVEPNVLLFLRYSQHTGDFQEPRRQSHAQAQPKDSRAASEL